MSHISFKNNGASLVLKNKPDLKKFISGIFQNEGFLFKEIVYIFTTDDFLLNLNRQFLNHDTLTDILTFKMSDIDDPICSEIYISIQRVVENSSNLRVNFLNELYRVMIHGVLHLCSYQDNSPSLKSEMRDREDFYLSQINFN